MSFARSSFYSGRNISSTTAMLCAKFGNDYMIWMDVMGERGFEFASDDNGCNDPLYC